MIQRRAARSVFNNYNLTDSVMSMLQSLKWPTLLQSLKWPTLEARRRLLKLTLMFKILNKQIHILTNNFQPVTTYTRGYQHHYTHLQCNCEAYKSSFSPTTI